MVGLTADFFSYVQTFTGRIVEITDKHEPCTSFQFVGECERRGVGGGVEQGGCMDGCGVCGCLVWMCSWEPVEVFSF